MRSRSKSALSTLALAPARVLTAMRVTMARVRVRVRNVILMRTDPSMMPVLTQKKLFAALLGSMTSEQYAAA